MKTIIPRTTTLSILFTIAILACNSQKPSTTAGATNTAHQASNEAFQIAEYLISIFEDSKGNLWFGTIAKGVARYDGQQLRYFTTEDGLNSNRVGKILGDADGNLWMGTGLGISKYDGQSFQNFTERDGLCDDNIRNLMFDKSGTLWIGSFSGVCTFDGSAFEKFELPTPDIEVPPYQATSSWLTEITEDDAGNIWFARDGYGICIYDGNSFTHLTKDDGLITNTVMDIQEDSQGNFWISSRIAEKDHPDPQQRQGLGGLVKFDGENFIDFPDLNGLYNSDVFQIYRDTKDNIWIGTTDQGVYKYDGNKFTNYSGGNAESGFPKAVVSIFEDSKGNIWIGCAGGLFCLNSSGGIVNVTTEGPWE